MRQEGGRFDFGGVADSYDDWYDTRLGRTYDALEKRAVERMLPEAANAERLLEVGCGTGHWSAFFSGHGFAVTGVDNAPEMIAVAREKRIANASFEVADGEALPFEDGRFDVAAAITTLEFVRDAEAVVGEMARCTRRPGGVVLVGVLNALARVNARRKAAGDAPYSDARFFSPDEVTAILERFGKPRVAVAAFVPSSEWLLPVASLTDAVSRLLKLPHGAFVIGRVSL